MMDFTRRQAARIKDTTLRFRSWLNSPPGRGTIKCSLAYLIASMGTFAAPASDFLGRPGGKHVVATITVYFHASRSFGSMIEAVMIAVVCIAYAEVVSLLSMVTSVLVGAVWGHVTTAHVLVVVVFVGGGFGFIGWVKQTMGNPLVNVASTLASLAIITVVTKENHVVSNVFSNQKIVQVLKILVMGILSTTTVNLLLWRVSARGLLRKSMDDAATALGDTYSTLSASFLSHPKDRADKAAPAPRFASIQPGMRKNLREAKFEHYFVGHYHLYAAERAIVQAMETMSQSVGGLRSAAATLLEVLNDDNNSIAPVGLPSVTTPGLSIASPTMTPGTSKRLRDRGYFMSIPEVTGRLSQVQTPVETQDVADTFRLFASFLQPVVASLSNELAQVLHTQRYATPEGGLLNGSEELDRSGLDTALQEFQSVRAEAMHDLYSHAPAHRTKQAQTEFEQMAAACSHLTFSVTLFAKEVQRYLDLVDERDRILEMSGRSWAWLFWWRADTKQEAMVLVEEGSVRPIRKSATPRGVPDSMREQRDTYGWRAIEEQGTKYSGRISQKVMSMARRLAKDDILFGLKVGIGAAMWASLAFMEETRDWYSHYRGEWGLLSFMIVCSMTVGASNTTGWSRFMGTLSGAVFSLINWNLSQGNPFILAILGWAVAFWNFALLVALGKGPLGRMTLLSYNVSTLYAYSMSREVDYDDMDDEGGEFPNMWTISGHRVTAVTAGILWGLIVCRVIWPISARTKFKEGLAILCLQMGLIWKRGPLAILLRTDCSRSYLKSGEQVAMQRYADRLDSLCQTATSEFQLRGPFPSAQAKRMLRIINRILDTFYAMSLVTQNSGKLTEGEKALLRFTAQERSLLCDRICHIFQVIASSTMLEYPLTSAVPSIEMTRDRLLARVFYFRKLHTPKAAADFDSDSDEASFSKDKSRISVGSLGTTGSNGAASSTTGHDDNNNNKNDNNDLLTPRPGSRGTNGTRGTTVDNAGDMLDVKVEEKDYTLLYAYALVTGQIAEELKELQKEVEGLYGVLAEDALLLQ